MEITTCPAASNVGNEVQRADLLLEECPEHDKHNLVFGCPKHEGYLDCGPLHPYCPTREAVDR